MIPCFGSGVTPLAQWLPSKRPLCETTSTNKQTKLFYQLLGQFLALCLQQTKSGYFGWDVRRPKHNLFLPGQVLFIIKMHIINAGLQQHTLPKFILVGWIFQEWRKSISLLTDGVDAASMDTRRYCFEDLGPDHTADSVKKQSFPWWGGITVRTVFSALN